ncbi:MAG: paraquat-inducible protein A [Rhodospirillales bacterium]
MMVFRWVGLLLTFRSAKTALSGQARGIEKISPLLLIVAAGFLAAGLYLPVVKVTKLLMFTDDISILGGVASLFTEGEIFLAAVVGVFSVVLPAVKIVASDFLWRVYPADGDNVAKALDMLGFVARWSMLDVLIVALLVFSLKASMLGDATAQPGIYFFSASVVLSAVGVTFLKRAAVRAQGRPAA